MSASTIPPVTFYRGEDPLKASKLNEAFAERLWRRGDKMLGSLILAHDPLVALEAATKQFVEGAVDYAVVNSIVKDFNGRVGYIELLSSDVTDALGYTPYDAANPAGYITAAQVSGTAPVQSVAGRIGNIILTHVDITDWAATLSPYALASSVPGPSSTLPLMDSVAAVGTGTTYARADHVHSTDVTRAPILSPTFLGIPSAATAAPGTSTAQLATTAFVSTALVSNIAGVSSFNTRTGVVSLTYADVTSVLLPSSTLPLMNSTAAIGTGVTWARADHVHPTDTSRYDASNPAGYQTAAQVSASLAGYLPLTGGTLTGGLHFGSVTGSSGVDLSRHIDLWGGTFGIAVSASQFNFVMAPACSFVYWNSAGTWIATISSGGANIAGNVTANAGRIIAAGNSNPSCFCFYPGFAGGMWMQSDGTLAWGFGGGDGVPSDTRMYINRNGDLWISGGKAVTCGYVHSTGSILADGGITGGSLTSTGGIQCFSGIFYVANTSNYYMGRDPGTGSWNFVENGTVNATVRASGNLWCRGNFETSGWGVYYSSWNGSSPVAFYWDGYSAYLMISAQNMGYLIRSFDSGDFNRLQQQMLNGNAAAMYAWYGAGAGAVTWAFNWSDRRLKKNIRPTTVDALSIINRLQVHELDFTPPTPNPVTKHHDFSLIADEVAELIPQALLPAADEKSFDSLNNMPIVGALVRAVQQLTARVAQLEGAHA